MLRRHAYRHFAHGRLGRSVRLWSLWIAAIGSARVIVFSVGVDIVAAIVGLCQSEGGTPLFS